MLFVFLSFFSPNVETERVQLREKDNSAVNMSLTLARAKAAELDWIRGSFLEGAAYPGRLEDDEEDCCACQNSSFLACILKPQNGKLAHSRLARKFRLQRSFR